MAPRPESSHVRMNVAQLKLLGRKHLELAEEMFPRSNERGSIEALKASSANATISLFPRSNERGSIEADCFRKISSATTPSSHVRMNVAQLKHIGLPQY